MQYMPSIRYTQLQAKLIIKKKLTPEEGEEFMKLREEEKAREAEFIETLDAFHKNESESRRKSDLQKVRLIAEARRETKKKLSPLGVPKKESEEGQ